MSIPSADYAPAAHNPVEPTESLVPTVPASLEAQVYPQSEPIQHDSATTRAEKLVRHAAGLRGAFEGSSSDAVGSASEAPLAQEDDVPPSTRQKGVAPIKPESVSSSEAA